MVTQKLSLLVVGCGATAAKHAGSDGKTMPVPGVVPTMLYVILNNRPVIEGGGFVNPPSCAAIISIVPGWVKHGLHKKRGFEITLPARLTLASSRMTGFAWTLISKVSRGSDPWMFTETVN